jgi:hypothetical protein
MKGLIKNKNEKKSKETYLYLDGVKKIVSKLNGKERIHIGIRPFGFHAGNKMALLAYPYLLCEEMEKIGKKPEFSFFISLNDFEPNELSYLEKCNSKYFYKKISEYSDDEEPTYNSNIFCEKTNIGNLPDPFNCCKTVVDHYEKIISKEIKKLFKKNFCKVNFKLVRNSSLIKNKSFKKYLKLSIQKPKLIAEIIEKATGEKIIPSKACYAGAICPGCFSSNGITKVLSKERVFFKCNNCNKEVVKKITAFDYWIYHKPLLIPRLIIFKIDLCIRGGDHYNAGNVDVNSALLSKFEPRFKKPMTLITPVVKDGKGIKLSKSYKNICDIETAKIIEIARNCKTDSVRL